MTQTSMDYHSIKQKIQDAGRITKKRYYTITMPYNETKWPDMQRWCKTTFGQGYKKNFRLNEELPYVWWSQTVNTRREIRYYFEQEKHAVLFALKWI